MTEQKNADVIHGAGWSKALKGCAIVVAVACVGLIGLLIYVSQRNDIQSLITCRENMTEVGQAVIRYQVVNDRYPDSLDDIKKEYLKSATVLICSGEKLKGKTSSYIYHKPPKSSGDSFILLECKNHVIEKDNSMTPVVTLDGNWSIQSKIKSK